MINYRSLKPEMGGLFCERIFGPSKDWKCACGKYERLKYKGKICERCGVEVTSSKVRRERMGHIELAVSVVHPWYLHRSKIISDLLGIDYNKLVKIVYYDKYIVLNVADSDIRLKTGQILDKDEYLQVNRYYGNKVVIDTGADAVLALLEDLDLNKARIETETLLDLSVNKNVCKKLSKRLKAIDYFFQIW